MGADGLDCVSILAAELSAGELPTLGAPSLPLSPGCERKRLALFDFLSFSLGFVVDNGGECVSAGLATEGTPTFPELPMFMKKPEFLEFLFDLDLLSATGFLGVPLSSGRDSGRGWPAMFAG